MMKTVKVTRFGNTHFYAQCRACDWNASIDGNWSEQDVRNAVYKHVRQTEHTVVIEASHPTYYSFAQ